MKSNVSQYDFERAFVDMGRGDNFTYDALRALYDYLIELEEGTGEEWELDVIGLCCDYSEHDSALEAAKEYGFEPDADNDYEQEVAATEWLNERTQVISFADGDGGVIIAGF